MLRPLWYCHCGIKIQPLFARRSCIFLMTSLTKLRRDGRARWVCSSKLSSAPYDQKKMYMQLELEGDYCAHVEQSNQPRALLSLSALPLGLTLTNVKPLFFHGSGGMSLVGYAQAPFSALAALASDCQTPQINNDCLSSSACCHPTPVLVGYFRDAWRTESLLSVGEWLYCIFRGFFYTLGWCQQLGDRAAGPQVCEHSVPTRNSASLGRLRSWASWASCLRGWRWGCITRHCAGRYSCCSSSIWEWASACLTCHNNISAHAK